MKHEPANPETTGYPANIPVEWTTERRLRSAVFILDGACDQALRLATMDDRLRTSIKEARAYAEACRR